MKIKILHVVGNLRIGGAETVAMNIYRYIDRDKFEMHYLVYGDNIGAYEQEVVDLGGKVIHMQYSPKKIIKYKNDLKKILNDNGPYTIVHAHMMFHNGIVLETAKRFGVPIAISHSHSTNDGKTIENFLINLIRKAYIKKSRALINKNSDVLIACGEAAGKYLYGEETYKNKGMLIKNGIDIEKYSYSQLIRAKMREQYGLDDKKIFACIGHFDEVKNHDFLINVFNQIAEKDKNSYLVLLGDGVLRKRIEEKCCRLGIQDRVLFMGNVQNVNEWLQLIDFLLMPSLYEGVPVTLIEAQASGVKCIVSDRVSKEVNITNNMKFLPLDVISEWINLDNYSDYDRTISCKSNLVNSGYDIRESIKILENKYLSLVDENI